MRVLADECCPRAVVEAMRHVGLDVCYAAETDARSSDTDLLAIANAEKRIIVTEDFDFGDLLFRNRLPAMGAIIVFLPTLVPDTRADRLTSVMRSLDQPAFGWTHLNADKLIYFKELEHLICVRSDAGCSRADIHRQADDR